MSLILLVVAIVCFALYGLVGFVGAVEGRVSNLLLGVGLAAFAASFLSGLPD